MDGVLPSAPGPAATPNNRLNQQLLRLTELLQLQARARSAGRDELGFVIVNETVRAVAYDQAALWDVHSERIEAVSGAARPERGAPYLLQLERLYRARTAAGQRDTVHRVSPEAVPGDHDLLAPHLLWWPLQVRGVTVAVLVLGRATPWGEADLPPLDLLLGSYAQAWALARSRPLAVRPGRLRRLRTAGLGLAVLLLAIVAAIPVPTSSIAPAEVVARQPAFVRAPFAGIVDAILVSPNAPVTAGQVVVALERRQLEAELTVAAKALETATAQFRQVSQEAIGDPRAREQLAAARARLDEARADHAYRQSRLDRAAIVSPADGIAVFNDPADWVGRPVEVGERILMVAPATSARIEIELPAAEATRLEPGTEVVFFSNLAPDRPIDGRVAYVSYAATQTAGGVLAYTLRADLDDPGLRLGLKGTAKIYGPSRPLVLWLLRRPIATLRQWLA